MICPHCGKFIEPVKEEIYSETGRKPLQKKETHSFTLNVGNMTDKAFNVNDGIDEFWIPKSQVTADRPIQSIQVGDTVIFEIPDWLAKKKGLVDQTGVPSAPQNYEPPDDIPF